MKRYLITAVCGQCGSQVDIHARDHMFFGTRRPVVYTKRKCKTCGTLFDKKKLDPVFCNKCQTLVNRSGSNRCPRCDSLLIK